MVSPSESLTKRPSAHASRRAPPMALRTVRHTTPSPWSPQQTIRRPCTCPTARCVRRSLEPFPRIRCWTLKARHRRRLRLAIPSPDARAVAVRAAAAPVTVAEAPAPARPRPTTTVSGAARVAAACYADLTRESRSESGSCRQGYVGRTHRPRPACTCSPQRSRPHRYGRTHRLLSLAQHACAHYGAPSPPPTGTHGLGVFRARARPASSTRGLRNGSRGQRHMRRRRRQARRRR